VNCVNRQMSPIRSIRYLTISLLGLWACGLLGAGCTQDGPFARAGLHRSGWHIVAKRIHGTDHDRKAKWVCDLLKSSKGIDPAKVYMYNDRGGTVVAYGRYRSPRDRRARRDLKFIKSLGIANRGYVFLDAHFEPAHQPDPSVPQQWLVTKSGAYWTLEIARFDSDGRKKSAVELVEYLRAHSVPAYVWHGPIRSMVTVGAFGKNAVSSTRAAGPGRPVIITKPIPADPQLRRWKKEYPYLIINSSYINLRSQVDEKKVKKRLESKIIRIRQDNGSLVGWLL